MNRYEEYAVNLANEINELYARAKRFESHKTLYTRAPRIRKEIARLEELLPTVKATAKWANEVYR